MRTAGSTNNSEYFRIVGDNSHATPGEPITGLLYSDIETGGSASYMRQGAARVDLTLTTLASASAAHSDGGFILVDDTNQPGIYRCDFPDAAYVTGVQQVIFSLVVASANNAIAIPISHDLIDFDMSTATPTVGAAASVTGAVGSVTGSVGSVVGHTNQTADHTASIAAILTDTGTTLQAELDAIQAAVITNAAGVDIAADIIAVKAETAAIVADTNELQTDDVPGLIAALDAVVDTVKVDTAAILTDTAEIGTAGAGLTDLGGMSTAMKAEVNAEADTALTDYAGPTNAQMEARTPTAAQLAYIVANSATGMPVTFTTAGGSTTTAVLNLVDGAAGSATNDQYNGRLLVFTDGTLKGCVTDITDYVGSTTTATITAIPFAPTSSHNARLI